MLDEGEVSPEEVGVMSCHAFLQTEPGIRAVLERVSDVWTISTAFVRPLWYYQSDTSDPMASSPAVRRSHKEAVLKVRATLLIILWILKYADPSPLL